MALTSREDLGLQRQSKAKSISTTPNRAKGTLLKPGWQETAYGFLHTYMAMALANPNTTPGKEKNGMEKELGHSNTGKAK